MKHSHRHSHSSSSHSSSHASRSSSSTTATASTSHHDHHSHHHGHHSHHGHHRRSPWRRIRRAFKNLARYFDRRDVWIFATAGIVALIIIVLAVLAGSGGLDQQVDTVWQPKLKK